MLKLNIANQNKTYIVDIINDLIKPDFQERINKQKYRIYKGVIEFDNYVYNFNKYLICQLAIFDEKRNKIKTDIKLAQSDGFITLANGDINKQYELVGIVAHSGVSIGGGHYLAYIKHTSGWYYYDDNKYRFQINDNCSYDNMIEFLKKEIDDENEQYIINENTYLYKNSQDAYIVLYREFTKENFKIVNPDTIPDQMADYLVDI
jgi:hypothetical protein